MPLPTHDDVEENRSGIHNSGGFPHDIMGSFCLFFEMTAEVKTILAGKKELNRVEQKKRKESDRLFEYPFDFDAYIQECLRGISDLDERKFAKTVLLEGLLSVIRTTEEKYLQLEHRVYEEIESRTSRYAITSTAVYLSDYDPTNPTLFPVCREDLKIRKPDLGTFQTGGEQDSFCIGTIFLRADNVRCMAFQKKGVFAGRVKTQTGTYEASFHVKRAARYRGAVAHLYELFVYNSIPWTTVNTGYLDKFFDVCLQTVEGELKQGEQWESAEIDYGEFQPFVREGMLPLWNVGQIVFSSKDFVVPCIDSKDYEHELPIGDFGEENGYLIEKNREIVGIRNTIDKIVMRSPVEVFENWTGYKIVPGDTVHSLRYDERPIGNRKKDSFIRRYMEQTGVRLHSKSDLYRRVGDLGLEEFLKIAGVEVLPVESQYPLLDDMNWFIKDELYPLETRRILLLQFEAADPGNYLNDALVQFAVSQIQLDEGEYRCVGVLV